MPVEISIYGLILSSAGLSSQWLDAYDLRHFWPSSPPDMHSLIAPGPLQGIRVLDLCQGSEQYCGKLFAQLGADVVLVEPGAGAANRREGPFLGHAAHRERSLSFAYFNQGKRGIALDVEHSAACEVFLARVRNADLVIEAEPPGRMGARGLGAEVLLRAQPSLVVTSITPFGQAGPFAHFQADDLVALAFGGLLSLGGYPGLAPTAAYGNQAVLCAAQFAAVASLVALSAAQDQGGRPTGQHIDVSVQESVTMALENAVQFVELEQQIRKRNGGEQRQAGTGVFPCSDGMGYLMAGGEGVGEGGGGCGKKFVECPHGVAGAGRRAGRGATARAALARCAIPAHGTGQAPFCRHLPAVRSQPNQGPVVCRRAAATHSDLPREHDGRFAAKPATGVPAIF